MFFVYDFETVGETMSKLTIEDPRRNEIWVPVEDCNGMHFSLHNSVVVIKNDRKNKWIYHHCYSGPSSTRCSMAEDFIERYNYFGLLPNSPVDNLSKIKDIVIKMETL